MRPQHYQTIHAFFDYTEMPPARCMLNTMIRAADADKIWQGRSPADLLYFTEKLNELIEASFSLTGWYDFQPAAIIEPNKKTDPWSLGNTKLFCGKHRQYSPWDYFPRTLSKKEFLNPYLALEKFTAYKTREQWKETIHTFLMHALSPRSIDEFEDGTGILRCSKQLNKLIEASHLIHLRTQPKKQNQ